MRPLILVNSAIKAQFPWSGKKTEFLAFVTKKRKKNRIYKFSISSSINTIYFT